MTLCLCAAYARTTERAERHGVPVIESSSTERATAAVLELVLSSADRLVAVR